MDAVTLTEAMVSSLTTGNYRIETHPCGPSETAITVYVQPSDVGKVIGRGGTIIKAMRSLLCAVSGRTQHKYYLEVDEERENRLEG